MKLKKPQTWRQSKVFELHFINTDILIFIVIIAARKEYNVLPLDATTKSRFLLVEKLSLQLQQTQ